MVSQLRTSTAAGASSLGRLPDSPLPELLHGDGYKLKVANGFTSIDARVSNQSSPAAVSNLITIPAIAQPIAKFCIDSAKRLSNPSLFW
jgi:hypothetical protein